MFVCELCGNKKNDKSKPREHSFALYQYKGSSKDISGQKQVCEKCYKENKEK